MDLRTLQKLVAQGEGLHLEFKTKATHPEKIAREMVAFANTKGGTLLVGVNDDKSISGCKFPEEEIFAITEYLSTYCRQLQYELERIPISAKKEVLRFYVPESEQKPEYLYPNPALQLPKRAYVRVADKSVQASLQMEFVLRYEKDPRDVRLHYGKREESILKQLEQQPHLTFEQTRELLRLPAKPTSITLVTLVRAGILQLIPTEQGDIYRLNEGAFG